jgi:molecular chaperone HscB
MQDPFALLGIEPVFNLDRQDLEARFLAASSRCHPDRFTDPLDQADAAERMSQLTDAHRVLRDDERRARALLALRQGAAEAQADDEKALPPDLLMEMMEVREALDDAVSLGDQPAVEKHRAWAHEKRAGYLAAIGKLFDQEPGDANAAAIRLQLNGLRYIERMLEQVPVADDASADSK